MTISIPFSCLISGEVDTRGVYKQRTGDKHDGCAIFYRPDRLHLIDHSGVEYFQPGIPTLDKDNVALLAKLKPVRGPDKQIVVATTHLLYNPKRMDIKLAQLALLVAELDRFCSKSGSGEVPRDAWDHRLPCIVTGDFNLNPDCGIFTDFLINGRIEYSEFLRRSHCPLLPPELGITDRCQHIDMGKLSRLRANSRPLQFSQKKPLSTTLSGAGSSHQSIAQHHVMLDVGSVGSGELNHDFGFRSAYRYQYNAASSSQHNGFVVVDYMLYSTRFSPKYNRYVEGNLKLLSRLQLPTADDIKDLGGLPSEKLPSDHVSLVAKFLLT